MDIVWENLNTQQPSLEYAAWSEQTVKSTVVGLNDGPFVLHYALQLSSVYCLERAEITLNNRSLQLTRSDKAKWSVNGQYDTRLDSCDFIDIQATPLTNTLPIRHLALGIGESAEIKVAWVGIPSFEVKMMQQRYTHLGHQLYRYQNLTANYHFDLLVDEQGLVKEYPRRFIRRF